MSTIPKLAVPLLVSLWFVPLTVAQGGPTGAIAGVVQYESGALAEATVSVKSQATGEVLGK